MTGRRAYLLVDGYNVVNDWEHLKAAAADNLQTARDMLVETLAEYAAFTGTRVLVVFDAYRNREAMERRLFVDGVEVFFTKRHQTADAFIEKRAADLAKSPRNSVLVATSDGTEQRMVLGKGASRISSRELLIEVTRIRGRLKNSLQSGGGDKTVLGDRLDGEVFRALEKWLKKED